VSVLLRQAHGFEGVRTTMEELLMEKLSVSNGPDSSELGGGIRTTANGTPNMAYKDSVAKVQEVADRVQRIPLPGFAQKVVLTHNRFPSHERTWLWPTARRPLNHIRMVKVPNRISISGVPGIKERPHDLHVLLRHRLLLETGGFERFTFQPEPVEGSFQRQVIL
jgi:hypothetical protein